MTRILFSCVAFFSFTESIEDRNVFFFLSVVPLFHPTTPPYIPSSAPESLPLIGFNGKGGLEEGCRSHVKDVSVLLRATFFFPQ